MNPGVRLTVAIVPHDIARRPARAATAARAAAVTTLLAGLLVGAAPARAQVNALQANLFVPAPTASLAQWTTTPSVAMLTVTNSAGVDVDVTVTAVFFKSDVEVGTAPGRITTLAGATADTTVFIPVPRVATYTAPAIADWRAARFIGDVGRSLDRTGRLPDGEYSLCVRFENATTVEPTPRTVEDVAACASFRIGSPQPPTLLFPSDESNVMKRTPVFTWTPVVAPGVTRVDYELRVVEVLPGQTPTRAIEANYPVFETTVQSLTSLPYPPSALPLEVGTRYAWRVRSLQPGGEFDDFAQAGAPLGQNEGLSEVFTFTRTAQIAIIPGQIRVPTRRPTGPTATPSPFYTRLIHGTLQYAFDRGSIPAPTRVPLPVTVLPVFPLLGQPSGGGQAVPRIPPVGRTQGPGGGPTAGRDLGPQPLEGVTVRLVVRYRTEDDWALFGPVHVGGRTHDDVGRIVATATTDSDGRFMFVFHDEAPTGVIAGPGEAVEFGRGEMVQRGTGPLARFYQIEVGDPHFLSPSDEIVVGETEGGDVGTLVSLVRSYRLRLHVIDDITGDPPAGGGEYTITVARQVRPAAVPETEGEGPLNDRGPYVQVTRKRTGGTDPVVLRRLVRNVGPSDRYRIIFSVPDGSELHYRLAHLDYANAWAPSLAQGGPGGEATFNEDYDLGLVAVDTLRVVPLPPRYIGELVDARDLKPIEHAFLVLTDENDRSRAPPRRVLPADEGRFVWSIPAPPGTNAEWKLHILAPGFELKTVAVPTAMGVRAADQRIPLQPAGVVRGTVEAPDGAPVPADVWYGDFGEGVSPETSMRLEASRGAQGAGSRAMMVSSFSFRAPAPSSDTLHVAPTADAFCKVAVPKRIRSGVNDLGAITVPRKDRRVAVRVVAGPPGSMGGQLRTIVPGATTELIAGAVVEAVDVYHEDGTTLIADTTGRDGRALLRLGPGPERVRVRVRGPGTGEYETRSAQVSAAPCGDPAPITVALPPASRIAGTVYAGPGTDGPVAGARVGVVGRSELVATTDDEGRYEIRGVPRLRFTIRAGGVNTGVPAEERELTVSEPSHEDIDFHLGGESGADLDWGDGLLGFPVLLTADPRPTDGGYAVTGLVLMPSNPVFAYGRARQDTAAVPFDDVVVRPDAQRRPVPVAGGVELGATELRLRLLERYSVVQHDGNGLTIRADDGGRGALVGPVSFLEGQLLGIEFEDAAGRPARPRVRSDRAGTDVIETLTADATAPDGSYRLAGGDGGPLRLRMHGFAVDAPADGTVLDGDGLRLDATVHTGIAGVDDLALPATGLRVAPGANGGPQPLTVDHALERPLQRWTLRVDGWSLVQGMARLTGGELVVPVDTATSATVNLPLVGVRLLPDALRSATFRDAPLSLGGLVDLDVRARDLSFGRDGEDGPWRVWATSGVTIPALPGMRPTDAIPLGLLTMQSDGETSITPEHGTVVRLFDAADFHVRSVIPGRTALALGGALDAAIPNVAPQTHSIRYRRGPRGLEFDMVPIDIGPVAIGGARLRIEDAVLDSTGLHGGGYVEVPDRFRVATRFHRVPPSRGDRVEAVPEADATLDVGEIAIDGLEGGARFLNGRWQTRFDGDLDVDGEIGGRLSFDVEGSDVNVGTAGLEVSNVATPFGDLTIAVNFPLERIEGSMDIDGYITDGLYGTGRAEMVVSGAGTNRYWHIYAGLGFLLESPRLEGSAAFIIGNTTLSGRLLADFNQYSVHGVPPSFYRVRGFFLEGQVSWPVPICPSGGVDIGVAHVGVWCNISGDLRMGMNFLDLNTYHIGGLVGVNVGASGKYGLGMCVSLWGEAAARADLEGAYRSDGAWYVLGRADFDLRGGASYGVGVDDVCLDYTTSFSIGLGAAAQLGHNWNTGEGRFVRIFYR